MASASGKTSRFEAPGKAPDGFVYHDNFLSPTEEQELIGEIEKLELAPFKYHQFTGKRRTVSFGWDYEFGQSDITTAPDMPAFLTSFRARAGALFEIEPGALAQASVIEYSPGAPIGWHRDIHHFGAVVGLSLGSSCRMRFRKYLPRKARTSSRSEVLSIALQPRSIYLMSGPSRQSWQHSIPPVKELRYAVMMRTVRGKD
jgi:alkylated DNA repair dioxygenase AlkB